AQPGSKLGIRCGSEQVFLLRGPIGSLADEVLDAELDAFGANGLCGTPDHRGDFGVSATAEQFPLGVKPPLDQLLGSTRLPSAPTRTAKKPRDLSIGLPRHGLLQTDLARFA